MLTELVTSPFVPNDTSMELETGRIQVLRSFIPTIVGDACAHCSCML